MLHHVHTRLWVWEKQQHAAQSYFCEIKLRTYDAVILKTSLTFAGSSCALATSLTVTAIYRCLLGIQNIPTLFQSLPTVHTIGLRGLLSMSDGHPPSRIFSEVHFQFKKGGRRRCCLADRGIHGVEGWAESTFPYYSIFN